MTTFNHSQNLRVIDYKSAISNDHKQMFDRLITSKINPNKKSNCITHPIFLTIIYDQPEYCQQLIQKFKISVTMRDMTTPEHKTILQTILTRITKNTPVFLEIFKKNLAQLINLTDVLGYSSITYLFAALDDLNIQTEDVKNLYINVLKTILEIPNINYNKLSKRDSSDELTPLIYLVKSYISPINEAKKIKTDLFIEIFNKVIDSIKSKIGTEKRDNFNPNLVIKTKGGTLLNYLIQTEIHEVVERFLKFPNVNPNVTTMTLLGKESTVNLVCRNIYKKGNTADQNDYYKNLLVMLASHKGLSSFNFEDSHGQTPLKRAVNSKNVQKIRFMLNVAMEHGISINLDPIRNLLGCHSDNDNDNDMTLGDAYNFFSNSPIEELMDIFDLNFHPPIPADRLHLVFLEKVNENWGSHLWLTEKADGIYKNSLPKTVYPELHSQINGEFKIEAEWIEDLGLYLVFNIVTPEIAHLNYGDRMCWLRSLHPKTRKKSENKMKIHSLTDFAYKMENQLLQKFLDTVKEKDTVKWWPKLVFETNSLFKFLSRQKLLNRNYSYHNGVYENDGIIAIPELHNQRLQKKLGVIAKIKPKSHQTLDLEWVKGAEGNKFITREGDVIENILLSLNLEYRKGVWRCYWNDELESWIPKEHRPEKKQANPRKIFKTLTETHNHPITLEELTLISNKDPPYYTLRDKMHKLKPPTIKFLETQKISQNKFVKNIIEEGLMKTYTFGNMTTTNVPKKWIDLGFGNTSRKKDNIWSLFPTETKWNGIDLDPMAVWTAQRFYPKGKWVYGDFCSHYGYKDDSQLSVNFTPYNGIITINSAHFAAGSEKQWANFRSQIDNMSSNKAYWIMVFLDADLLNSMIFNSYKPTHGWFYNFPGGFLRKVEETNNVSFTFSRVYGLTIQYQYSWAHKFALTEPVISYERFKKSLVPKWKIVKSLTTEDLLDLPYLDKINKCQDPLEKNLLKYQRCFRYLLLQKNE